MKQQKKKGGQFANAAGSALITIDKRARPVETVKTFPGEAGFVVNRRGPRTFIDPTTDTIVNNSHPHSTAPSVVATNQKGGDANFSNITNTTCTGATTTGGGGPNTTTKGGATCGVCNGGTGTGTGGGTGMGGAGTNNGNANTGGTTTTGGATCTVGTGGGTGSNNGNAQNGNTTTQGGATCKGGITINFRCLPGVMNSQYRPIPTCGTVIVPSAAAPSCGGFFGGGGGGGGMASCQPVCQLSTLPANALNSNILMIAGGLLMVGIIAYLVGERHKAA